MQFGVNMCALGWSPQGSLSFDEVVRAASRAGFRHIGLDDKAIDRQLAAGQTLGELKRLMDGLGLQVTQVHLARLALKNTRADEVSKIAHLCALALAFDTRWVSVAIDDPQSEEIVARTRAAADECAKHALGLAVEFMPFTGIRSLAEVRELMRHAGRGNIGIQLDVWHLFRGGSTLAELARLRPDEIAFVQFDDARPATSEMYDDTRNRRLPGEGELDLRGFARTLRAIGYEGPIESEVLHPDNPADPEGSARRQLAAMTPYFASG